MCEACHRCHRELPGPTPSGGDAGPASLDDDVLFCPRCGAPQIRLPEYLRAHLPTLNAALSEISTSGALPPPRVAGAGMERPGAPATGAIDWRLALRSGLVVAAAGALMTLLSLVLPNEAAQGFASLLSMLVALCGAIVALGLYAGRSPHLPLDARLGLRIGLVTGVLLVTFWCVTVGTVGVLARFVTHGMGAFDATISAQMATVQAQTFARMQGQPNAAQMQAHLAGMMASPEVRGGAMLAYTAIASALVLLVSAAGGAFAGMLRNPRTRAAQNQ